MNRLQPLIVAALLLSTLAQAEEPKPLEEQVFRDWALLCEAERACWLQQRVLIEGEQEPLMQVQFQWDGEPLTLIGLVRLPLGVALAPGVQLQADGQALQRLAFSHCDERGCYVLFAVTDALRKGLEAGRQGEVVFQILNGKTVTIPFSLLGMTAGLQALDRAENT